MAYRFLLNFGGNRLPGNLYKIILKILIQPSQTYGEVHWSNTVPVFMTFPCPLYSLWKSHSLFPKTDQLTHSTNIMCFILSWTDAEGVVPGRPRDLSVIEATRNYVVLSWKPPGDKGHEGVMYYVEKVREQNWV